MDRMRCMGVAVCATLLGPIMLVGQSAGAAEDSVTFSYTGDVQYLDVPAGVSSIEVDACGGQGGEYDLGDPIPGVTVSKGVGGRGGRAISTVAVTPGEQLAIFVGGSGASGGWNGGGTSEPGFGSFGGGASDVRRGGASLADRVVIGGGGGGGGFYFSFPHGSALNGGIGGGLTGGGPRPGTQTGPGVDPASTTRSGSLGLGGNGTLEFFGFRTSGGGAGLYGGAAGDVRASEGFEVSGASGGSGLGDTFEPGVCVGDGEVTITFLAHPPSILPSGAIGAEGDTGSTIFQIPVRLSAAVDTEVTVDWATGDLRIQPGYAQAGTDFVAASGTITFPPGQTEAMVPVEILGDTDDEAPLLWGEWGVIVFSNPANATIDTGPFFGLGLFIIFDDD